MRAQMRLESRLNETEAPSSSLVCNARFATARSGDRAATGPRSAAASETRHSKCDRLFASATGGKAKQLSMKLRPDPDPDRFSEHLAVWMIRGVFCAGPSFLWAVRANLK